MFAREHEKYIHHMLTSHDENIDDRKNNFRLPMIFRKPHMNNEEYCYKRIYDRERAERFREQ